MTPAKPMKRHIFIALALCASFAVSACGIRGTLKTPPPIWGEGIPVPSDAPADASTDTTTTTN